MLSGTFLEVLGLEMLEKVELLLYGWRRDSEKLRLGFSFIDQMWGERKMTTIWLDSESRAGKLQSSPRFARQMPAYDR